MGLISVNERWLTTETTGFDVTGEVAVLMAFVSCPFKLSGQRELHICPALLVGPRATALSVSCQCLNFVPVIVVRGYIRDATVRLLAPGMIVPITLPLPTNRTSLACTTRSRLFAVEPMLEKIPAKEQGSEADKGAYFSSTDATTQVDRQSSYRERRNRSSPVLGLLMVIRV
jgi:hypothetical protein